MITGGNYEFIKLLHVAIFIVSGLFGMRTIVEALEYACEKKSIYPRVGVQVFKFWIIILAFVGAQLSWSLRPFVGDKNLPFTVFREQGGNSIRSVRSFQAGPDLRRKTTSRCDSAVVDQYKINS